VKTWRKTERLPGPLEDLLCRRRGRLLDDAEAHIVPADLDILDAAVAAADDISKQYPGVHGPPPDAGDLHSRAAAAVAREPRNANGTSGHALATEIDHKQRLRDGGEKYNESNLEPLLSCVPQQENSRRDEWTPAAQCYGQPRYRQ
jgi:hypothetical protein